MKRRVTFDDWWAERTATDPELRRADSAKLRKPPRRKLDVICDENLEEEVKREIGAMGSFRIDELPAGTPDHRLWDQAQQRRKCLITADQDFWNDILYPIERSPGLVLLRGASAAERAATLRRWWDENEMQQFISWLDGEGLFGWKWRASPDGALGKFVDGPMIVEVT
jgi:predicted nuclease of predicted toxin-antitoxin system